MSETILIHSSSPDHPSGYGVHTKNLARRLSQDYDVAVHAYYIDEEYEWEGIPVLPGGRGTLGALSIPGVAEEVGADLVFSHRDQWNMSDEFQYVSDELPPTILYTIIDHEIPSGRIPRKTKNAIQEAEGVVTMSEWATGRLNLESYENVWLVPHGVDTDTYRPLPDDRVESIRAEIGVPTDALLYGVIAGNYGLRKEHAKQLHAFAGLCEERDDAYLYVHTDIFKQDGYDLREIRECLGIEDRVIFTSPGNYASGLPTEEMVELFNAFDVLVNCSQGESWGLPITEAMACGTPVICTNNTSQTEQLGADPDDVVTPEEEFRSVEAGLLVHRGSELWLPHQNAYRFSPYTEHIEAAMKAFPRYDSMFKYGEDARKRAVKEYDFDMLFEDRWSGVFEAMLSL